MNPDLRTAATHGMTTEATGAKALSLRRYLLLGILVPVCVFVLVNTWSLYRQALVAANTAYDRTLLASAKFAAKK